ncbi:hypothetical protein [Streptomyces sp. CAU 1734]|uniref:hypothetical protein n=1 Tax=Streptomyces sp. CAU 1734 TaxID=3140360 RepID=UPI003260CB86
MRPLTVGIRANTLLAAGDRRVALDAIQRLHASPDHAVHMLTPRRDTAEVLSLLASHGIDAQSDAADDRQFWNEPAAPLLVTDSVVQGDVRIGRGVVLYQGDWARTLGRLAAHCNGRRRILSRYDGVVHDRKGWQNGLLQEAVDGAPEALRALLDAGHSVHISTQRPIAQLPEIAQWLRDRGVPAETSPGADDWDRSGTVLVTGSVLPSDLEIENRGLNLDGDNWEPIFPEVADSRRKLAEHLSRQSPN